MSAADETGLPTRSRRGGRVLLVISVVLVVLGLVFSLASAFAPEAVDRVTGEAKVTITTQLRNLFAPDDLPVIRLGDEGQIRDLDDCDGTFTEMVGYRLDGVPPLYAAHNFCGGDAILGWGIGERVRVEGSDTVYEVVEERRTVKWADAHLLQGMQGEFLLQTCFYGQNLMRFVGLAPVDARALGR
ncbi:hypothetical protein [Microbacterium sp. PA5]|uniref:hypothetical protein n=1 Tax=Microbacterium sp. PA5 TaxID=3416654 RepID=UPI003CE79B0E